MSIFGALFGKTPKGYSSKNTGQYEDASKAGVFNRAGATYNPATKQYDTSNIGKPIEGAAGVQQASQGYNLNPQQQAIAGYNKPTTFTQTYQGANYKPSQFDFKSLPEQYGTQAYNLGSKDVLRQGAGSLQQLQQATGTRRPGVLANEGGASQRGVNENLANMRAQIALEQMKSGIDMGKAQQEAQAGENMNAANFNAGQNEKAYQSRSDLERSNEANRLANLQGLDQSGQGLVNTQQGLVGNERDYQDKALQMMQSLWAQAMGGNNASAGIQAQNNGAVLGSIASAASKI